MSLKHKHILITRPQPQAQLLASALNKLGATTTILPTITINYVNQAQLKNLALNSYDKIIIVSQVAVQALAMAEIKPSGAPTYFAVGETTANCLSQLGIQHIQLPMREYNSEALLQLDSLQQVKHQRIAIISGEQPRRLLHEELSRRGALIDEVFVYRRLCPRYTSQEIKDAFTPRPDCVITTSQQGLNNLNHILTPYPALNWQALPLLVISHNMVELAEQLGIGQLIKSQNPTTPQILAVLQTFFNRKHL